MIYALIALLAVLMVADAVVTFRVLANGGREVNPMGRAILRLGLAGTIAIKLAATVLVAWLLLAAAPYYPQTALWTGIAACAFMAAIVAWNIRNLRG